MKTLRVARKVPFGNVRIDDAFWSARQDMLQTKGLQYQYQELLKQGCPTAFQWKPGMPDDGGRFRDSDMAKWIEAVAFSLAAKPDAALEKLVDDYVAILAPAQHEDGYLCSYYGLVKPQEKYTNLRGNHELYRMGHMIEAAIAYHAATGKREFLDIMIRCALGMGEAFGREPGKKRGYCGHEEMEMALVRLYQHTGDRRHLNLAQYFVEERGQKPHYFEQEALARGEPSSKDDYAYFQAHKPVREQDKPLGHAVRAVYLYSAMADLALEANDATLLPPLRKLWREILDQQIYIHGGIGPTVHGEQFTFPYHLPNETAYAETCAAIGMVFWAHRMLQLEPKGEYGDLMERALYNSVATGVSLNGDRYAYAHPLTVFPGTDPHQRVARAFRADANPTKLHGRSAWFDCPCCPPNLARVILSMGGYAYTASSNAVWVNLYMAGSVTMDVGDGRLAFSVTTDYPWDGKILMKITEVNDTSSTFHLRIPAWCRKPSIRVNGTKTPLRIRDGYAAIKAKWKVGDSIQLDLPMLIEFMESHPAIWQNGGKVALQRGPILYCVEQVDNGPNLTDLVVQKKSLKVVRKPRLLNGVPILSGKARVRPVSKWKHRLYQTTPTKHTSIPVTAIPYCLWGNRESGSMTVWVQAE